MTESARKQTEKTSTTQTVRVPLNLATKIWHRMADSRESFQAYALRLMEEDIARGAKADESSQPSPAITKNEYPDVLSKNTGKPYSTEGQSDIDSTPSAPQSEEREGTEESICVAKLQRILRNGPEAVRKAIVANLEAFSLVSGALEGKADGAGPARPEGPSELTISQAVGQADRSEEALGRELAETQRIAEELRGAGKPVPIRKSGDRKTSGGRGRH